MSNQSEKIYTRPPDLLKALDIDIKPLTEDELAMQKLLVEKYKADGKSFVVEVKKWREVNPDKSFGDAIRTLYEQFE